MIHIELTGSTRLTMSIGSIRSFFKREYTHPKQISASHRDCGQLRPF